MKHSLLAVGQGDAHIIECKMIDNCEEKYEYAMVDAGTTSGRKAEDLDEIGEIIMEGKVKNIFLTHPDWDHISYIPWILNREAFEVIVARCSNSIP